MIHATIQASRLRHAVSVLQKVNDEAIFQIANGSMSSRVVDPANALMVQVMVEGAGIEAESHTVGVNLERLAKILKRASVKDNISIDADDANAWHITRGIHQRTMRLLDPARIRKYPERFDPPHTVEIRLSGGAFKTIVAEAEDVSKHVLFHATLNEMVIEARSTDMEPDTYRGTLPADQYYSSFESEAECQYTVEYLQDIVTDMRAADDVVFKFSTGFPCEIGYVRDNVSVWYMLAPRMESD